MRRGWWDGLETDFKISRKKRNFVMTKRIVNMITLSWKFSENIWHSL